MVVSSVPKTSNVQVFSLFTFDSATQRSPLLRRQTAGHRKYGFVARLTQQWRCGFRLGSLVVCCTAGFAPRVLSDN